MSSADLAMHSAGQCVSRVSKIWSRSEVIDALSVEDEYELIDGHRAWQSSGARPPRCAISAAQSEVTQVGQGLGSIFTFGTQTGKRIQIRDAVKRCASAVYKGCGAPLIRWRNEVKQIRAEPQVSYNNCRTSLADLQKAVQRYTSAERALEAAQKQANALPRGNIGAIDLADAWCAS